MSQNPLQPDPLDAVHGEPTPADLRVFEQSLSRLALSERAAAGSGFEDRLMTASVGTLGGAQGVQRVPALGHDDRAIAGVIYRRLSWRMRLAAAVMLTAGVGIAVLAVWGIRWSGTGTNAHTSGEQVADASDASSDVDSMLAAVEALDTLLPMDGQIADADATDSPSSLLSDVLQDWPAGDDEQGVSQ